MTEEVDMNTFKGLTIMLLTIIAYMVIDSLFNIQLITFMLCAFSGSMIILACRKIKRESLNTFRALLVTGVIFFIIGNYILLTEYDKYYYDPTVIYTITMGFFLSAVGMIVMFSSIPLIIYKDLEEHFKQKSKSINQGLT